MNDSCLLLSSIDRSAQIFKAMKDNLTTMKNKLKTLKIENRCLFDRIKELKIRIESMNEIKNIDVVIDFLDRDFNDEKREYENE
jgi:predicted nuclease with TOPRIM domain